LGCEYPFLRSYSCFSLDCFRYYTLTLVSSYHFHTLNFDLSIVVHQPSLHFLPPFLKKCLASYTSGPPFSPYSQTTRNSTVQTSPRANRHPPHRTQAPRRQDDPHRSSSARESRVPRDREHGESKGAFQSLVPSYPPFLSFHNAFHYPN
jgi:hypothetical protein